MSLADALKWMLEELQGGWLEVIKVPTCRANYDSGGEERGYIRVAVSQNAEWYQKFCGEYVRDRGRWGKARTYIKRGATIKALQRMLKGDRSTVYALRLLEFIQRFFDGEVKV